MPNPRRFRVRPVYHGSELLIEMLDDHREEGFPDIAGILRDALHAAASPHPNSPVDRQLALAQGCYLGHWIYPGGSYEIDDDIWSLFISAKDNNQNVIADIERALLASGRFLKVPVDFEQFK